MKSKKVEGRNENFQLLGRDEEKNQLVTQFVMYSLLISITYPW